MTRATRQPAPAALTKARDFIDRHYARPLTVAKLAALAGLSPFHVIRAFRAAVGQTPHRRETPAEFRAKRRRNVYIPGCFVRM